MIFLENFRHIFIVNDKSFSFYLPYFFNFDHQVWCDEFQKFNILLDLNVFFLWKRSYIDSDCIKEVIMRYASERVKTIFFYLYNILFCHLLFTTKQ